MKFGILFAGALGMLAAQAAGTWAALNSGTMRSLKDFQCPHGACYAAGDSGTLLRTQDGGTSWESRSLPVPSGGTSIAFSDSLNGFHANGGNLVYRTSDGGISWSYTEATNRCMLVHLVGKDEGYFAGMRKRWYYGGSRGLERYYTEDVVAGPLTQLGWDREPYLSPSPKWTHPTAIQFTGGATGFSIFSDGRLARTMNWTNSWTIHQLSPHSLNGLHFPRSRIGYVVGDSGRIFRTQDSGSTWSAQSSGTLRHLRGVRFADGDKGYVVGDSGTILETSNGGDTWTPMASGTSARLNAIILTGDGSMGFAAGEGGVLLKLTGGVAGVPATLAAPKSPAKVQRTGLKFELPDGRAFNLLGRQGR